MVYFANDPNTIFASNLVFRNFKEPALSIVDTNLSLIINTVEAQRIESKDVGSFIYFQNNRDLNSTNICCSDFKSTARGLFYYVRIKSTLHASYLSFDSSYMDKSSFAVDLSTANVSYVNISNVKATGTPGLYLYGSETGKSNVAYYTVANSHATDYQITESTKGCQTWTNFNAINCSSQETIFKIFSAATSVENAVFAGNWDPSGKNPSVVRSHGGILKFENVIIQSNGTVIGATYGYTYQSNPKPIDFILPNRNYCRALFDKDKPHSNKHVNSAFMSIVLQFVAFAM